MYPIFFDTKSIDEDIPFIPLDVIEEGMILQHVSGVKFKVIAVDEALNNNDLLVTAITGNGSIERYNDDYLSNCYDVSEICMFERFELKEKLTKKI